MNNCQSDYCGYQDGMIYIQTCSCPFNYNEPLNFCQIDGVSMKCVRATTCLSEGNQCGYCLRYGEGGCEKYVQTESCCDDCIGIGGVMICNKPLIKKCYDTSYIRDCNKVHQEDVSGICQQIPNKGCWEEGHLVEDQGVWKTVREYCLTHLCSTSKMSLNACHRENLIELVNGTKFSTYNLITPMEFDHLLPIEKMLINLYLQFRSWFGVS